MRSNFNPGCPRHIRGSGRGHCAIGGRAETRRYGAEHAIGSSDLVNYQRYPEQQPGIAELQSASRKLTVDKTCHVIDHCDVLRGPSNVGDPALERSLPV